MLVIMVSLLLRDKRTRRRRRRNYGTEVDRVLYSLREALTAKITLAISTFEAHRGR